MVRTIAILCVLALGSVALSLPMDGVSSALEEEVKSESWFSLLSWSKKSKDKSICEDLDWRKFSFKLAMELPAAGLFRDLKGTSRWETSGMDVVGDQVYMIFDSLAFVGKTDEMMQYRDPDNMLITHPGESESDFEAIQYSHDTDTFIIVREAVPTGEDETYTPSLVEAKMNGDTYKIVQECRADYTFDNDNKGWEGGLYFSKGGERYFLGLCEGNYCEGGAKGREKGNGMTILTKLKEDKDGKCLWEFVQEVPLPKDAMFQDYSDLAMYGKDIIAVVSQEESAVWIGKIDTELWEISGPGVVYHFPRDPHCEMIYCNVEGIVFLDEYRLMTSSDAAKSRQPYGCVEKDQGVQVFYLPKPLSTSAALTTELLDAKLRNDSDADSDADSDDDE